MFSEAFQGVTTHNPVLVLLGLLLGYRLFKIIYNLYLHPLSAIPGPPSWSCSRLPFIWAFLRGTIVHDIEDLHRKHGPVLRIAPNEVTFAKAEAWNDIFQPRQNHQQFLKDPLWWQPQPGRPASLITAINPDKHTRMRKTLAPAFTPRALKSQEPMVLKYVNLLIERLEERASQGTPDKAVELDIGPWLNFTAFDIFGDLAFGESFDCLQHSQYHPWIALLFNSVKAASFISAAHFYPLIDFVLMKCIPPSLDKMQEDHYQQIVDKVNRRFNWEVERPDIMSHIIKQGQEKGLSIGEIHATFGFLAVAGSETTATTLIGAVHYLTANPHKLATLTDEIRKKFPSRNDMSLDSLRDLSYLNAVIHESLRLCPAVPWVLPRVVPAGGDTVCGINLPGGTPVSIQAWTLNRDPDLFHNASSFEPERWLPEAIKDPSSPFHYDNRQAIQPFSIGPRNCMGQHLAWAEMRSILAKMVWSFDIESVNDGFRWENLRTFLLVEKRPVNIRIKPRAV